MRKTLTVIGQVVLLGIIAWFVWRALNREIAELGRIDFPIDITWGWVALATLTIIGTYATLIHAWRTILGGWGQSLGFRRAARIWTLSNLGRYVPGKIWTIAGMTMLARQEGVTAWAAGGSAVAMQFIALGTGAAVIAATTTASGTALPFHSSVLWVVGFLTIAVIAFLATSEALSRVGAAVRPGMEVRPLAPRAAILAVFTTAISWTLYGLALWMLARGLLPDPDLQLGNAVAAFTSAYIVGLIAVMAPGGIVVREAALVTLLAPSIGAGAAVTLAVAARVVMTVAELAAAAIATLVAGPMGATKAG